MLTIYSKNNCPYCVQAKNLLTKKNIMFEEVKIDENLEAKQFILEQGHRTVPQIYYKGKLFVEGGFTGLAKLTEIELKTKLES